jgi:hypothetical protein
MAEELPSYTREELDQMSRVKLRQTAVNCGKSHREATNMESEAIKDFVMGKQEGGGGEKKAAKGGRKGKSNGKPATAKQRGKAKAAPEPEPEDRGGEAEAPAGELGDMLHKLGLGMDDGFKEMKECLETLQAENEELRAEITEVQHAQFLLNGLVTDILSGQWEPTDVKERVEELEGIWQEQQDEGGDDEGNE